MAKYASIDDIECGNLVQEKKSSSRGKASVIAGVAAVALCGTALYMNSASTETVEPMYASTRMMNGVTTNAALNTNNRQPNQKFHKTPQAPLRAQRIDYDMEENVLWSADGEPVAVQEPVFVSALDLDVENSQASKSWSSMALFGAIAGSLAAGYTIAKKGVSAKKVSSSIESSQDSYQGATKAKLAMMSIYGQQPRPYDSAPGGPEELIATAAFIASKGKGILASDESSGTCGLRLQGIGVENTEENRRAYRELLFTTPNLGESCSGAILFEETLFQSCKDGTSFVDKLKEQGVTVGIKVDKGLKQIPGLRSEVSCTGLDDLPDRAKKFYEQGARFAKWRAVLNITSDGNPSELAIQDTAYNLARYASICQAAGLVPIVEPEILMDGDHTIEQAQSIHERVWAAVYKALHDCGVLMEGSLLKPSMVVPGVDGPAVDSETIAKATVDSLMRRVPPAVAGITFLSGGQSEEGATHQLNDMNVYSEGKNPWSLTFSYGRALQASVLKVWDGKEENVEAAQKMLYDLLTANGKAQQGIYDKSEKHPSTEGSLYVKDYKY